MNSATPISLFWFRRDLRIQDNCGLFNALVNEINVQPIFIFDATILNDLDNKTDRRVQFIHEQTMQIKKQLNKINSDLWVYFDKPENVFKECIKSHTIKAVYCNHDYEPYAIKRDTEIKNLLQSNGIPLLSFKDQVIFEKQEITKANGTPYTVFTPYMRQWKKQLQHQHLKSFPTESYLHKLNKTKPTQNISLKTMGFIRTLHNTIQTPNLSNELLANYHLTRDALALSGTSRVSVHLRFGTISIRQLIETAIKHNETYTNELIWREFYMQILWHFPHVVTQSFKLKYDQIPWNNSISDFERWCNAETGYPIVDAAMNELSTTGFMHNRARMITASFLCKHLLIDWRKGEAYFAKQLNDYELSSNNGGWQWAASSGCDAVPYFRIFNPYTQTLKFDPEHLYINRWNGNTNITPIIEHTAARERCLTTFKAALK